LGYTLGYICCIVSAGDYKAATNSMIDHGMNPLANVQEQNGWAVIFDLDETLVLTSSLEPLRAQRDWQKVYAAFSQTSLPPQTAEFMLAVEKLAAIAVVTKSPRPYAEKLIRFHGLNIKVAVAYHDVARRKPHPEGLIKAAAQLGVEADHCIYIGDHPDDSAAAAAAGQHCLMVRWIDRTSDYTTGRDIPDSGTQTERTKTIFHVNWREVLIAIQNIINGGSNA
jgi:HAD superfamily hydrolase (TIGR01549 family)